MEKGGDSSLSLPPLLVWAAVSPLTLVLSHSLARVPSGSKVHQSEITRHRASWSPHILYLPGSFSFYWKLDIGILPQAVCPLPGTSEEVCGLFLSEILLADGFSWRWVVLPSGTGMTARRQWPAAPGAMGRAVRQLRSAGKRKPTSQPEPTTAGEPWPTAKGAKA